MNTELTVQDWKQINDLILQMNYEPDILLALKKFLTEIDKMAPYEKASIYFYSFDKNGLKVDTYLGEGFSKKELVTYDEYYFKIDDIVDKLLPTKLTTIKSSEVFNQLEREETEYFNDYVKPVKTVFSLDANFRWNKEGKTTSFGTLDLFRSEKDFTEKEMEICRIVQPHIETKASQYVFTVVNSIKSLLTKYSLTKTENNVARLILRGYTNEQISSLLYITVSTVKKHVAAILDKSHCQSRVEFICKVNLGENGR
jgi:DNA-binding CsgD family transcriptional regulator